MTAAVITVAVFLFYYTHYTIRGGSSDLGSDCGLFSIVATSSPGNQSWNRGAALSIYTSYYTVRGGLSTLDTNCGAFFINAASITTSPNWYNGAALLCFILCSSWWSFWL